MLHMSRAAIYRRWLVRVDAGCLLLAKLGHDFKNELDFDRHAEGQAGDAEDDAARKHPGAEDLDEELGRSVGDFRMVPEVAFRRDVDASFATPVTLSSAPRYALAADKALRQAISAAFRPSSADSAPPTRPTYWGSRPATGSMPLRKSRLPIFTLST